MPQSDTRFARIPTSHTRKTTKHAKRPVVKSMSTQIVVSQLAIVSIVTHGTVCLLCLIFIVNIQQQTKISNVFFSSLSFYIWTWSVCSFFSNLFFSSTIFRFEFFLTLIGFFGTYDLFLLFVRSLINFQWIFFLCMCADVIKTLRK